MYASARKVRRFSRKLAAPIRTAVATCDLRRFEVPEGRKMSIGLILMIVLVLMLVGAVPAWPHSRGWGYGPSGGLGLVVVVVLVLLLMGRI
jgi:hypothetical protein